MFLNVNKNKKTVLPGRSFTRSLAQHRLAVVRISAERGQNNNGSIHYKR